MSILIKDIEMPKSCWDCFACHDGWCIINQKIEGHRTVTHSCPLIEVPTPHGRLIDANPIMKFIQDGLNNGEFGYDQIKVMGEIQYAPTIIESEDE